MSIYRAFQLLRPSDYVPDMTEAVEAATDLEFIDLTPDVPEPAPFERAANILASGLALLDERLSILDEEIRVRSVERKETAAMRDAYRVAVERTGSRGNPA